MFSIWQKENLITLAQEREKVLAILNDSTKDLDFLPKNRLIYMMQKNIIKNKRYSSYFQWFEFAEKTRNPNNKRGDFFF